MNVDATKVTVGKNFRFGGMKARSTEAFAA